MPEMSLPQGWASYKTEDGKEYFHHAEKNLTQWDTPAAEPANLIDTNPLSMNPEPAANPMNDLLSMQAPATNTTTSSMPAPEMISLSPINSSKQDSGQGFNTARDLEAGTDSRPDLGLPNIWGLASLVQMLQDGPFDVTTEDVKERIMAAVVPNPAQGKYEPFETKPDFWGPFWIATTCCIFFAGTANFTKASDQHTDWGIVGTAACLLYGALVLLPLALRGALFIVPSDSQEGIPYFQVVCVFGYSLLPMLPVSLLCCIIYVGFVRWIIMAAGLAWSLLFFKIQLFEDLKNKSPAPWFPAIVPVFQVTVFLFYRIFFLDI